MDVSEAFTPKIHQDEHILNPLPRCTEHYVFAIAVNPFRYFIARHDNSVCAHPKLENVVKKQNACIVL